MTSTVCIVPQDLLDWLKTIRHEIDVETKEIALQANKSFDLATGEMFDVVCGPHESPSGIVWAVVKGEDKKREVVILYEPAPKNTSRRLGKWADVT